MTDARVLRRSIRSLQLRTCLLLTASVAGGCAPHRVSRRSEHCGIRITRPLDRQLLTFNAMETYRNPVETVEIVATANVLPGTYGLQGDTHISWNFPKIAGMKLELQPSSGGPSVREVYHGYPGPRNPSSVMPDGDRRALPYRINAWEDGCMIGEGQASVNVDITFLNWDSLAYTVCRSSVFGTATQFGNYRGVQKHVPELKVVDFILRAMDRSRRTYGMDGWQHKESLKYGAADFAASIALESDFDLAHWTEGTHDEGTGRTLPERGYVDVGPAGINYREWNQTFRWRQAGLSSPQEWESKVFGNESRRIWHHWSDADTLEHLKFGWWLLGFQTHRGYNRGDPHREAEIAAYRPLYPR